MAEVEFRAREGLLGLGRVDAGLAAVEADVVVVIRAPRRREREAVGPAAGAQPADHVVERGDDHRAAALVLDRDFPEADRRGPRLRGLAQRLDRLGETPAEHGLALTADVDAVIQGQVDDRHRQQVAYDAGQPALLFLDTVPVCRAPRSPADHPADLHDGDRQPRIAAVAAEGGAEPLHAPGVERRVGGVRVAAALVPEHAGHASAVLDETAHQRAVETVAAELAFDGIPLGHAGAAVGAGDEPLRDPRLAVHLQPEGRPGTGAPVG